MSIHREQILAVNLPPGYGWKLSVSLLSFGSWTRTEATSNEGRCGPGGAVGTCAVAPDEIDATITVAPSTARNSLCKCCNRNICSPIEKPIPIQAPKGRYIPAQGGDAERATQI